MMKKEILEKEILEEPITPQKRIPNKWQIKGIRSMNKKGYTLNSIATSHSMTVEEIQGILQQRKEE